MRIQQLRFKNLNSLTGEWSIDLTHPAFAADGIFAIIGPTGAGKSTILDAICLALYGRTPRLSKINRNSNEIMSRQTGECFAEVTFETQAGRFRCHWSQHRSRRKAGGELQSPKHEIADADSGQIVGASIRDVAGRIETATGMDFERFTRSMLLAQGGFAAFLEADADQRAPILEQITGTEIYSRISVRVHERRAAERKTLELLTAELAGMQLLSAEDEATLTASLDRKLTEDAELSQQVTGQQAAIAWLDRLAQLGEAIQGIEQQTRDWQVRQADFQPERERLERAILALELVGEHTALATPRRQQEQDRVAQADCLAAIPSQEALLNAAEGGFQTATRDVALKKAEQQTALLVIRQVRALDLRLLEKERPIKATGTSIDEREQALAELRKQHQNDSAALAQKRQLLDALLVELESTKADAALVEQLAGIRGQFDALRQLGSQQNARATAAKLAETTHCEAEQRWKGASEHLDAQYAQLKSAEDFLSQEQLALKDLLRGRELGDWRNELTARQARLNSLEKVGEAHRSLTETTVRLDALRSGHGALTALADREAQARCRGARGPGARGASAGNPALADPAYPGFRGSPSSAQRRRTLPALRRRVASLRGREHSGSRRDRDRASARAGRAQNGI